MADIRYPVGSVDRTRVINDPNPEPATAPTGVDQLDSTLFGIQSTMRRKLSALEPPPGMPGDPWLVPAGQFRTAQAEQIRRDSASMAVHHDSADMGANFQTQGLYETASNQLEPRKVPAPARVQVERLTLNNTFRSASEAIAALNRESWRNNEGVALPNAIAVNTATTPVTPQVLPPAASVDALGYAGKALGAIFDGKRFVKYLSVRTAVAADNLTNGGGQFHGDVQRADAHFENVYNDLPRPLKLLIDEMSPANAALTVAGGAMVEAFGASSNPAAKAMLAIFRPMTEGVGAFPRQAAFGVASRSVYEFTDGAPLPVRLASGAAAGLLAGNPEMLLDPSARYAHNVWRALVDEPGGVRPPEPPLRAYLLPPALKPNIANTLTGAAGAGVGFATGDTPQDRLTRAATFGGAAYLGGSIASRVHRTLIDPPDVLPLNLPTSANGVRSGVSLTPAERFAQKDAIQYAADLAEQQHQIKLGEPGANAFFTTTEVPPPVAWALQRAKDALRPGQAIEQAIEHFPLTRNLYSLLKPSATIPDHVRQAFWAEGAAGREFIARITPSRLHYVDEMQRLFGGTDKSNLLRYVGTSTRSLAQKTADGVGEAVQVAAKDHPLTNTVYDAITHPELYDLTDAQKGLIAKLDYRNSTVSARAGEFGVEIGDFGATPYEQLGYHNLDIRPVDARDRAFMPIVNAESRPGQAVLGEQAAVSAGRTMPRKYADAIDFLADPNNAGAKLNTDVAQLLYGMDEAKTRAVGKQVFRWGIGGQMEKAPGLRQLEHLGTYVTDSTASAVTTLEKESGSQIQQALSLWRGARLNGDMSPLTIQGALAMFSSPLDTAKAMVGAIGRGEMADMMSPRVLADDWARNPEKWLDFAFHQNVPVRLGTPEEFRAGFLEKLPAVGAQMHNFNEGMFNLNIRAMKNLWEKDSALLMAHGVSPEAAKAAAADTANKIIPLVDSRKLGISARRAGWEAAIPTSISFIRQPIAFATEAATAYVKMGLRQDLTANERLAAIRFAKLQGTVAALSITSAVLTAKDRNLSPVEAMQRAVDPNRGDFMRLWLGPNFSVPMGGPYRALIRGVWPKDVTDANGETHTVPFAGLGAYIEGRAGPASSTIEDFNKNKDFFGRQIVHGNFPQNIITGLAYLGEQTLPIGVTQPVEAQRVGTPFAEGVQQTVSQLAGQNAADVSPYEATETSRRGGFLKMQAAPAASGMSDAQQQAAQGATTLDALRASIGTTAANRLTEQNAPDFPASYDRWVQGIRLRAQGGDRNAQALLVGVDLQSRLTDLANEVTTNGVPDKQAYRLQRGAVVDRSIGANSQYADVFSTFGKSSSEIDQLSSQWYDLLKQAQGASGNVNYDLFNKLEDAFYAKLTPQQAELVRSNVESAPRAANPLEMELRQVRNELDTTGFFKIEQTQWDTFRKAIPDVAGKFDTFAAYRDSVVTQLSDAFKKAGMTADVALRFADQRAASTPLIAGFDKVMLAEHAKWALGNPDLAQQAIGWGYLSASITNVALSGAVGGTAPASSPTAPARATPTSTPSPDSQKAVELWESGKSYGQIGLALGKTDGAVEQMLRRHYGGSPDAARQKLPTGVAP